MPRLLDWFLYLTAVLVVGVTAVTGKQPDWLVTDIQTPTTCDITKQGTLLLTNGIIGREFLLAPNFFTYDYVSYEKGSLLRAVGPEAQIVLDNNNYDVGGVISDIPHAYLNRTALMQNISTDPNAFQFVSYNVLNPTARYPYKPMRFAPNDIVWPPKGLRLDVLFKAPATAPLYQRDMTVTVTYELYDGIPLLVKWVTIHASSSEFRLVEGIISSVEYLHVNSPWSPSGMSWLYVENDEPHGNAVHWSDDPALGQMPGATEPMIRSYYTSSFKLLLNRDFTSFRVHELVIGSSDPERIGLARRRKLRLLAPQTLENPIFFHMAKTDSASVHQVLDQMHEVGFEMLIFSFWTDFHIENTDPAYMESIQAVVTYAKKYGIEVGGYDLIALTRDAPSEYLASGYSPPSACFASGWYDFLLKNYLTFINKTGISVVETDGPYGGYACSSSTHAHHRSSSDSVYWQNVKQMDFFLELRRHNVYINQPDSYFYQGGSKTGMGYIEEEYNLPRWQDLSVSRQRYYDDMYHYTPSVGWMITPLDMYHSGGRDATFEPLSENIAAYEWALAQYFGAGVISCWRGHRLYDSNATKAVVKKWVSFYKTYRDILTSDIIHVQRPDMQNLDYFLHVNPRLINKGLAMVFNPTNDKKVQNITMPLYYTGLTDVAMVSREGKPGIKYVLERDYSIEIPVSVPPLSVTWFLFSNS